MRWVKVWKLFALWPGVFQPPLLLLLKFKVPLVAMVCAFFNPFRKIHMVVVALLNLHLLASHLNL